MGGQSVIGWKVPPGERTRLLDRFPPAYRNVVADHVTLQSRVPEDADLPKARKGRVMGMADDGDSLQALIVEIDGTTDRPDGSTYHITWSLDPAKGWQAVESNDVIRQRGWKSVEPVPVELEPARFP